MQRGTMAAMCGVAGAVIGLGAGVLAGGAMRQGEVADAEESLGMALEELDATRTTLEEAQGIWRTALDRFAEVEWDAYAEGWAHRDEVPQDVIDYHPEWDGTPLIERDEYVAAAREALGVFDVDYLERFHPVVNVSRH